jgi:hypothetical protein
MWPKSNNRNTSNKIKSFKAPKVSTISIPKEISSSITSQEPTMHLMSPRVTTNPMSERGKMFNNLKSFLSRNKIGGKI